MSDASTGHTRAATYTEAASAARQSAARLDDHAATARGEAGRLDGLPGMEGARDDLLDESRRAAATAADRRSLASGFQGLAGLEGR